MSLEPKSITKTLSANFTSASFMHVVLMRLEGMLSTKGPGTLVTVKWGMFLMFDFDVFLEVVSISKFLIAMRTFILLLQWYVYFHGTIVNLFLMHFQGTFVQVDLWTLITQVNPTSVQVGWKVTMHRFVMSDVTLDGVKLVFTFITVKDDICTSHKTTTRFCLMFKKK